MSMVCLKVRRYAAGSNFPFDRVYIFKKEYEGQAGQITPVNLVLPLKGVVKKLLESLHIDAHITTREGRRMDPEPLPEYTLLSCESPDTRSLKRGSPGRNRFITGKSIAPYTKDSTLLELCRDLDRGTTEDWRVLIPILNVRDKENPSGSKPSYLTNPRWMRIGAEANGGRRRNDPDTSLQVLQGPPTVPDTATLNIKGNKITPPCRACPRLLEHMHGDCQIGGTVCLSEMSFQEPTVLYEDSLKESKKLIKWHTSDTLEE